MEEDAGKSIQGLDPFNSLIDLNHLTGTYLKLFLTQNKIFKSLCYYKN